MIFSENPKPSLDEFRSLMVKTDTLLNEEAVGQDVYYAKRNGTNLEEDVFDALARAAQKTPFEGSIQLISGNRFPDIVAKSYYGVEVKSTKKNHWYSIGSSVLESTRVENVKNIFITFGKLGAPVEFKSRPYEECLCDIAVTHYPRYKINMELAAGQTIFDKMGVPYDTLRKMSNPVEPISKYYKTQLKPGESLWWAGKESVESQAIPATVKLWTSLSPNTKEMLTIQGYALFPEVLSTGGSKKYNRYALWLVTEKGIVNTNIRDSFSAGGKIFMKTKSGLGVQMPAAFGRIEKYHELIEKALEEAEEATLKEYWETEKLESNRLLQWCQIVASVVAKTEKNMNYSTAWEILCNIFPNLDR